MNNYVNWVGCIMIKKIFLVGSTCLVIGIAGSSASAATTNIDYIGTAGGVTNFGTIHYPVGETYSHYAGGLTIDDTGDAAGSFTAWCLDLYDYVSDGLYEKIEPPFTPNQPFAGDNLSEAINSVVTGATTRLAAIQKYFDWNYSSVDTANEAAAFQLGLWEIVFEATDAVGDILTGDIWVADSYGKMGDANTPGTIGNLVKGYLLNLSKVGSADDKYDLTFWDASGLPGSNGEYDRGSQELVSAVLDPNYAPPTVPIPATIWLLGVGVLGLFGFGRAKSRIA